MGTKVETGGCRQVSVPKLLSFRHSHVIQLRCDGYPTRKKLCVRGKTKLYNPDFLAGAALKAELKPLLGFLFKSAI